MKIIHKPHIIKIKNRNFFIKKRDSNEKSICYDHNYNYDSKDKNIHNNVWLMFFMISGRVFSDNNYTFEKNCFHKLLISTPTYLIKANCFDRK